MRRKERREGNSSSPSFFLPLLLSSPNDDSDFSRMVASLELDNLASTSAGPIRSTRDGGNDEDSEDERSRMLSRTELDSEDDSDEDGLKSLRRDLEKMEQEDEDDGSVESMVRKVSTSQREQKQEGRRERSWLDVELGPKRRRWLLDDELPR